MADIEIVFARRASGCERLERLIAEAGESIDTALYRLSQPRLQAALKAARERGARVRLCLNNNDHYEENRAAQAVLRESQIDFRLSYGRAGESSKMHHKFVVIDRQVTATGSYNWTLESENSNHENLVVIRDAAIAEAYAAEFEALWTEAKPAEMPASD